MTVVIRDGTTGQMKVWWDNDQEGILDSTPFFKDDEHDVVVLEETMDELNTKLEEVGQEKLEQRIAEVEAGVADEDIKARVEQAQNTGLVTGSAFIEGDGTLTDVWLPDPPVPVGIGLVGRVFQQRLGNKSPDDYVTVAEVAEILAAAAQGEEQNSGRE